MNRGHRKMAADTPTKTAAMRNFDLAAKEKQILRLSSLAMCCTSLSLNRTAVQTSSYTFEQIMSIICTAGVAFQICSFVCLFFPFWQ